MKVIVLANQKGGVGKTTLAGHLSVQASNYGKTAILDTDPQGSLSEWWNERDADAPIFAAANTDTLNDAIEELRQCGVKYLIVDTPPAVTATIRKVVQYADLVIIPTRPGPHDLRAVGKTIDLVNECDKKMVFVINGAAHRARITADAAIALSQHGAVSPTIIYQRTDFAGSMIDGRTVMELDGQSRSSSDIVELWDYVNTHLRKGVRK